MTRRRIQVFLSLAVTIALSLLLTCCSSSQWTGEWVFTDGPYAQNITAVIADRQNGEHLLASMATGDIYRSNDKGRTWTHAGTLAPGLQIFHFVQHPEVPAHFFALTARGIYRSIDGGEQWSALTIPNNASVYSLALDPYNPRTMYAGTGGFGFLTSTDGGETWTSTNTGIDSLLTLRSIIQDACVEAVRPDNLYGAIEGLGIVKSSDAGRSWTKLTGMLGSGGIVPTSIVVHSKKAGVLCYGMAGGSIYKSVDGGATWSPTRFGSGSNKPVRLRLSPVDPEVIYAGTENDLLISNDFGSSWKSIAGTLPRVATSIAVGNANGALVLYAFGEGIGLSTSEDNGYSWSVKQPRIGASTVSAIVGSKTGNQIQAVVGASVHHWNRRTGIWTSRSNGLTGGTIASITLNLDSAAQGFVATPAGIYNTSDDGATWTAIPHQLRGRQVDLISAHTIFSTRMLATSGNEVFASTNSGRTWVPIKPLNERCSVTSFTYSPRDAGFVLGATRESGVLLSTDGGLSWQATRYGLADAWLSAITLDEKDKSLLYAWTPEGKGYRSTNKGVVWDRYSPPWQQGKSVRIVFDRFKPSEVFALVDGRELYYSHSGGGTWFTIPVRSIGDSVTALYWNSSSATLYAGVQDAGVYRLEVGEFLRKKFAGE